MFEIRVEAAGSECLRAYSGVPITFSADSRLDLEALRKGEFVEVPTEPWTKNYDLIEGQRPIDWADQFDLTNWKVVTAWEGGALVGGAVIAFDTPGVDMLEGRTDLVVIWDIRVSPNSRGRGVGQMIFATIMGLARGRRCTELKVETQDINVEACRFYARQGCVLSEVNSGVYGELDETQLIWRRAL